jgi:hypothetical protein
VDLCAALVELALSEAPAVAGSGVDQDLDRELGRLGHKERLGRKVAEEHRRGRDEQREQREHGGSWERKHTTGTDQRGSHGVGGAEQHRDRAGSWERRDRVHGAAGRSEFGSRGTGRFGSTGPSRGGPRDGNKRYWVGVGRAHGAAPAAIVGAITGEGGLRGKDLGRIEMFGEYSLVEVAPALSRDTMRRIAKARVAGRALRFRPDAAA